MTALAGVSATGKVGMVSPRAYIPVVTTLTLAAATVALNGAGFQVSVSYAVSSSPVGTVTACVPAAGTYALQGTTVALTISSGPASPVTGPTARAATQPNLPNKILDQAAPLVDAEGKIKPNWWRLLLNISNQAFGTNANAETTITVGGSPFIYTPIVAGSVIVSGGAVSLVEYSPTGKTFYPTGVMGGVYQMIASSSLRVTYTNPPAVTFFPR